MIGVQKRVIIFGGTGFLGRRVTSIFLKAGWKVTSVCRRKRKNTCADVTHHVFDIHQLKYADQLLQAGFDVAVNLIGALNESKKQTFHFLHAQWPEELGLLLKKHKIETCVHVSAMGADMNGLSRYAVSKAQGEGALRKHCRTCVVLRPSVLFGENDGFFCRFARATKFLPFLPFILQGKTRFQPIWVDDVACAVFTTATQAVYWGKIYELGGLDIWSFKACLEYVLEATGRRRFLVPIFAPKAWAYCLAWLPQSSITVDQVQRLKSDNVVQCHALTIDDLKIQPARIRAVMNAILK